MVYEEYLKTRLKNCLYKINEPLEPSFIEKRILKFKRGKLSKDFFLYSVKECEKIGKNSYSVPLTVLDKAEYRLDYIDSFGFNVKGNSNLVQYLQKSLNKNGLWESIIGELEENCISKKFKNESAGDFYYTPSLHDMRGHDYFVEYKMPVSEYKIIASKKINKKDRELRFRNKYYDSGIIYSSPGGSDPRNFEKYGNFKFSTEKLSRLYGSLSVKPHASRANVFMINTGDNFSVWLSGKYRSEDLYESAEIDLGENTEVTHVGTMGMRHEMRPFPDCSEREEYGLPESPIIKVVSDIDKKWTTSYVIFVRVDSGKKWFGGWSFNGNTDRLTEVVHRLEQPLFVRYIRVLPKTYCNYPGMQISLFGAPTTEIKNSREDGIIYRVLYRDKGSEIRSCKISGCGYEQRKVRRGVKDKLDKYSKKYNRNKCEVFELD